VRALCVLQVSTRLGLFYIWHRLLSGISQLKKKNRETKNQKSEVRGHNRGPRAGENRKERETEREREKTWSVAPRENSSFNADARKNSGMNRTKFRETRRTIAKGDRKVFLRVLATFLGRFASWDNVTTRDYPEKSSMRKEQFCWNKNLARYRFENNFVEPTK